MYTEQTIKCADCSADFPFTASEQEFYAERGFSAPRRCKNCRAAAKAARGTSGGAGGFGGARPSGPRPERQLHDAQCAACGVTTQVPFKPTGDRPVYCRDCFRK